MNFVITSVNCSDDISKSMEFWFGGKSTEIVCSAGIGHVVNTEFPKLPETVGCKYGILFNGIFNVGIDDVGKFSLDSFLVCIMHNVT